jgi:hypothetical protein
MRLPYGKADISWLEKKLRANGRKPWPFRQQPRRGLACSLGCSFGEPGGRLLRSNADCGTQLPARSIQQ